MDTFLLGCLSNSYMFWDWERALRSMAKLGCKAAEMSCDRPHFYPNDFSRGDRGNLKALLASLDVTVTSLEAMHCTTLAPLIGRPDARTTSLTTLDRSGREPMFTSEPHAIRRARIDFTKQCIDLAADLGVPNVDTYSGEVKTDPDVAYRYAMEGLEECADYAASRKVHLILELTAHNCIIGTPDEVDAAIRLLNNPYVGISVDVGHIHMDGYDMDRICGQFGERIRQVHLADIKRRKHYHLIPGRGDVDFGAALRALSRIGYSGSLVLELYPYCENPEPAVAEGLSFIEQKLGEVGIR